MGIAAKPPPLIFFIFFLLFFPFQVIFNRVCPWRALFRLFHIIHRRRVGGGGDRDRGWMKIYFDTCCYGRPWDDQNDPQISADTTAIATIIDDAKRDGHRIFGSAFVGFELGNIRDYARRAAIVTFYDDTLDENFIPTESDFERR